MDTAEIERELDDLETRIDRLRALYEQYFLGIEKMEPLTARKEVTSSPAYAAGQAGQIITGSGKTFSLPKTNDYLKSQACDLVLKQAKNFK